MMADANQLSIPDLFGRRPTHSGRSVDGCLEWLMGTLGCTDEVIPYVERLFSEFDAADAFSRSAILPSLCGTHRVDGWGLEDAEQIGVFDHDLPSYHVIWDRHWAISMLVPKGLVPKVFYCDYGKCRFYGADHALLFTSRYAKDGRILTDEERRQAIAELGVVE